MSQTVYTLGYSGWKPEQILAEADRFDAMVVDVRLSPRSRVRCWTGKGLRELLGERYIHVREFGNVNYRNGGPIEIDDFPAGVRTVKSFIAKGRSLILLCACRDLHQCHRLTVAKDLAATFGLPIGHLGRPEKKPEDATLF